MDISSYNESGFASVLATAAQLVDRAAKVMRQSGDLAVPPVGRDAFKKEAVVCLSEAEALIAAVRKAARV